MKILIPLSLVLLLSFQSFGQSTEKRRQIEADVLAVMDKQVAAWNRGDIDGFMQGYWKSEDLVFISGDNVTRGWQSTLDRYKRTYNSKEKMGALKFGDVQVNVISKDAAVVLGSWSLTRAGDNPHGKYTLIFRKIDGQWRIVHDHTS